MGRQKDLATLDKLIEEILIDAFGNEGYSAFQAVLDDEISLPCAGIVIGEPVSIIKWDFDGNERLGVTATCLRKEGSKHVVAAWEVLIPATTKGSEYLAAYRRWMGLVPYQGAPASAALTTDHKAAESLDLTKPIELAVTAVKDKALNCRIPGTKRDITLRSSALLGTVPGMVILVNPNKLWTYARHEYLSGEISSMRIDAKALQLVPLKLKDEGFWDPSEMGWDSDGPSIEEWTQMLPINARGLRPRFEMEQILPGADPESDTDPIMEANELKDAGDMAGARKLLMELCRTDLRCLDAHAHLGNLVFPRWPEEAILHYEVGVKIGELSLGEGFDGLLPWILIDNRPFLRCLVGYALCLWRLARFEEAERIFWRMLLLNPTDNQGVRFLLEEVKAKQHWKEQS